VLHFTFFHFIFTVSGFSLTATGILRPIHGSGPTHQSYTLSQKIALFIFAITLSNRALIVC